MHQPESIEAMLSRLMPPALSDEGQRSIDAMLDGLCGEEARPAQPQGRGFPWKIAVPAGIAAAVALAIALPGGKDAAIAETSAPEAAPEVELVGESDRIETATDEGWFADAQGRTMQAIRVRVMEENTFRDTSTGILMRISQPREELVFSPVNEF